MVTLREVAKRAGVSITTVSSVLNGNTERARISAATSERVEEAARVLGYRHNALAKSLRMGKSNVVGILGHSFPPHCALMTREAARSLIDQGFQVAMQDLTWRPDDEAELVTELLSQRIDGLLLQSNTYPETGYEEHPAYKLLHKLATDGFPMVRVDGPKGLPVDSVVIDREHGSYMATAHLLELGHRRIAYSIDRNSQEPKLRERVRGYERAASEWQLATDESLFVGLAHSLAKTDPYQAGYEAMGRVLRLRPAATAFIATNDEVALGALCAAHQAGLRVPEDMAIVGFTGSREARFAMVPLTTIAFPWEAVAREAAGLLQERLEGMKREPYSVTLAPALVVRRSCGANPSYTPDGESAPEAVFQF